MHMMKHTLQRPKSLKKPATRIGKGGKRGKTSGRGMKGQKARKGNSTRPEMRDIIKKLPKRRGYGVNRAKSVVATPRAQVVNLDQLETYFTEGVTVSPRVLCEAGLVRRVGGKLPQVKVLARGTLTKKLTFSNLTLSKKAQDAIVAVGGSVTS
jgi:large subunit ribosomal protein L15